MHGPMSSISSRYTVPKRSCPSKLLRLALLCGLLGLAAGIARGLLKRARAHGHG